MCADCREMLSNSSGRLLQDRGHVVQVETSPRPIANVASLVLCMQLQGSGIFTAKSVGRIVSGRSFRNSTIYGQLRIIAVVA